MPSVRGRMKKFSNEDAQRMVAEFEQKMGQTMRNERQPNSRAYGRNQKGTPGELAEEDMMEEEIPLYETEEFQNAVAMFVEQYGEEPATDADFAEVERMMDGGGEAALTEDVMAMMGESGEVPTQYAPSRKMVPGPDYPGNYPERNARFEPYTQMDRSPQLDPAIVNEFQHEDPTGMVMASMGEKNAIRIPPGFDEDDLVSTGTYDYVGTDEEFEPTPEEMKLYKASVAAAKREGEKSRAQALMRFIREYGG